MAVAAAAKTKYCMEWRIHGALHRDPLCICKYRRWYSVGGIGVCKCVFGSMFQLSLLAWALRTLCVFCVAFVSYFLCFFSLSSFLSFLFFFFLVFLFLVRRLMEDVVRSYATRRNSISIRWTFGRRFGIYVSFDGFIRIARLDSYMHYIACIKVEYVGSNPHQVHRTSEAIGRVWKSRRTGKRKGN